MNMETNDQGHLAKEIDAEEGKLFKNIQSCERQTNCLLSFVMT